MYPAYGVRAPSIGLGGLGGANTFAGLPMGALASMIGQSRGDAGPGLSSLIGGQGAPSPSAPPATSLGPPPPSAPGSRVAFGRQIYDYFLGQGLAPHQAAAVAGNMTWEGGGRADLVNPGDNWRGSPTAPHSIGIAQWNDRSPALIAFARSQGIDIPTGDLRDAGYARSVISRIPLQTQLQFAWQEMQGPERRAFAALRGATDLRGATAGAIGYHRPAGFTWANPYAGHGFSGRLGLAQQIQGY
jgi:hypothetical protein